MHMNYKNRKYMKEEYVRIRKSMNLKFMPSSSTFILMPYKVFIFVLYSKLYLVSIDITIHKPSPDEY